MSQHSKWYDLVHVWSHREDSDHPMHLCSLISLRYALYGHSRSQSLFRRTGKALIRLCGCADWIKYSLCAHANLYFKLCIMKISKSAKIRNRFNQVPHLTQDPNGKITNSQLDTTNESQEVSPFPAGDHKAHMNRRLQMHSKHKTEKT